ncbi:2-amino-4-hydroxy-6-hydroxymethyldihydropteridine diphosphokinase, partial [bacterium]|nr:2-amino-4-hydroxy-6-hydroxymethyldihydropteridine diphosphokinase [bacterium]
VVAVSRVYETPPAGGVATRPFLNAAVAAATTLSARELLGLLNGIEAAAGRIRKERWADRTLDLDILLYGDRIIQEPGLAIPHPRLAERLFVLAPLADIAPDTVVPGTGKKVAPLLAECADDARATVVDVPGWT